jgi:hypothetical protein
VRLSVVRIFRRMSEHVRKLSSVGAAPLAEGDLEEGDPAAGPRAKSSQNGRGSDASSTDSDKRKVRVGAVWRCLCQRRRVEVFVPAAAQAGFCRTGGSHSRGRAGLDGSDMPQRVFGRVQSWRHHVRGLQRCRVCAAQLHS